MMKNKYNLYVLLTKTPLKTGKFLRKMTGYEYNHCSISFDENFKELYSFSRKYKNSTFYAGLVKESSLRYTTNEEKTKVKIFKIPLKKKNYEKIKDYLIELKNHEDEYIYNYLSIVAYPFHRKVKVKNAYTCCEFTVHILQDFCEMQNLGHNGYCSIKELSEYLNKYTIYEGNYNVENTSWLEDKYMHHQPLFEKCYKITGLFAELFTRFFKGLFIK